MAGFYFLHLFVEKIGTQNIAFLRLYIIVAVKNTLADFHQE